MVKGLSRDYDNPCYSGRSMVLSFSGEKKWKAIQKWISRSLMGKILSCGSSIWKIYWWIEISGSHWIQVLHLQELQQMIGKVGSEGKEHNPTVSLRFSMTECVRGSHDQGFMGKFGEFVSV